jgi:meso-butanediol dehydrogenase / (S,S)-butanediol dehydrogenase / diacetyl reductase
MTGRFEGKAALITGAGSGIGRATALRLASEGAKVFGHDVNEAGLAETASMVEGAGGIETRAGDLTDPQECKDAVAAAVASMGRLDVLGNVAGIARGEHVTDVTVEQYRKMMAVNVDACFFMAQAAIPHLLETGGNIVNLASNAGLMGQAYTVVYCMSKGAIVQMTKAMAMEYMKKGIRINAIAPAGTNTSLVQGYSMPSEDLDFDLFRYAGMRGMSEPEEVANLFAFLASDEARSIHGSIYSIDNGQTAG